MRGGAKRRDFRFAFYVLPSTKPPIPAHKLRTLFRHPRTTTIAMSSVMPARQRLRDVPTRLGWTVLNGLQLVFTGAWTAAWITLALMVRAITGRQRLPLRMAACCWAPGLLSGAGARLEVEGAENIDWSRPYLVVANHRSIIDICALFRALPVPLRFLLKSELGRVPFLGWYARAMGMVFIRRRASRRTAARLDTAADLLYQGATLCAFPEGTRGGEGGVAGFKSGPFRAAIKAGVPVLPISILGTGEVLPTGGFRVRPGRIRLRIGTPIQIQPGTISDRRDLARQARMAVIRGLGTA